MVRIAILDDWQDVARNCADWSPLASRANLTFFADAFDTEDEAVAALADFEKTQRTIIVLTNHPGVPGPRIRAHQVAEILFSD